MSEQQASVADEQRQREAQLVERVAASFAATPDPRLRHAPSAGFEMAPFWCPDRG